MARADGPALPPRRSVCHHQRPDRGASLVRRPLRPASALLFTVALVLSACQPSASESPAGPIEPRRRGAGADRGDGPGRHRWRPHRLNPGNGVLCRGLRPLRAGLRHADRDRRPTASCPGAGHRLDGVRRRADVDPALVDGAMFHDGTPLTSEDVKFSLELYRDTRTTSTMPSYPDVFVDDPGARPDDPRDHHRATRSATSSTRMVFMYVLPMHIWEARRPGHFENEEMIGYRPVQARAGSRPGRVRQLEAQRRLLGHPADSRRGDLPDLSPTPTRGSRR